MVASERFEEESDRFPPDIPFLNLFGEDELSVRLLFVPFALRRCIYDRLIRSDLLLIMLEFSLEGRFRG